LKQLSFEFSIRAEKNPYLKEDFILSAENKTAFEFLEKFFKQKIKHSETNLKKDCFLSLISIALLSGEEHCGKTHLLHIFYNKYPNLVNFINEQELIGVNLNNFFQKNHFYILENIEKIKDPELLLHIINCVLENSSFLILSSNFKVSELNFEIKDLNSRIKNIFNISIKSPELDLIKILLIKNFAKKQLAIDNKIIEFIKNNLDKSYQAIFNIVKIIEFHCQENRQHLTLSLVDRWLKNISCK
jgi:chromosomal replication initiation ATPase DnaA